MNSEPVVFFQTSDHLLKEEEEEEEEDEVELQAGEVWPGEVL